MANHTKENPSILQQTASGPVLYPNAEGLKRPMDMPKKLSPIIIGIAAAALVVGIFLAISVSNYFASSAERSEASFEQTINRGVTLDLPILPQFVGMDNASITATLKAAGYSIIDINSITGETSATDLNLVKLPSDVSAADAAIVYSGGISNLTPTQAATYLSGSWRLNVTGGEYLDMRIKYADFTSGDINTAIQSAMVTEGYSASTLGTSGVDASGNTYQNGTIAIGGVTYNWSVSACALSDVYSISGLPSDSYYVGIRLYQGGL